MSVTSFPGSRTLRLALPAVVAATISCPQAQHPPQAPAVTNVRELLAAPAAQRSRAQPVELRAVVTYFDDERGVIYLKDATGAVALDVGRLGARVVAGER